MTTAEPTAAGPTAGDGARNGRRRLASGMAAALVVGLAGGYLLGTVRTGVAEHVGDAYSSEAQIAVQTRSWTYAVPLDVQWTDAAGTWHSGRPACLPPTGAIPDIRFAAVPVDVRGLGFRQVVAVFCD